eukprot:TRINITY_DN12840_c0_g1_i2.p2 TRINITY_DN12840_c0_g1~~TRINITY_DN12840_c0_g1_i2.p2  ORF type:complete len:279 (-),score=77.59 TRINITY_DN12840_c0_g1_i2:315-1151(-)
MLRQPSLLSSLRRLSSTLVLAETSTEGALLPVTRSALSCAAVIGHPVDVVVPGLNGGGKAEAAVTAAAALPGVRKVISLADTASTSTEALSAALAALVRAGPHSHLVAASATVGRAAAVRAAGLLDVSPVADVTAVGAPDTFTRAIYAGNALETVKSTDSVVVLTARGTSFDPCADSGGSAEIEDVAGEVPGQADFSLAADAFSAWQSADVKQSDKPSLAGANVVVAGGRGMKNGGNFGLLEELADAMGGAVGASRAAVDAGWVENALQIGQVRRIYY